MWEFLGISKSATITGLVGSALAALGGSGRSKLERFISFCVGSGVAVFAPEIVIQVFGLKAAPALYSALGFFLGYFGFRVMDAVMQVDLKDIANSWLKK